MAKHLNLALVHALQILVEEGTFRGAATRLYITAPAMTQQIKRLEESVGYTLVARGTQPVRLTNHGENFMMHAREALEASNRALGSQEQAALRIGFINGYPRSQDEGFLIRFRRHNPDISLHFIQLNWGDQITKLLSGDVDASLARPPHKNGEAIECLTVHREPRVVAVPSHSSLAGRGSLELANIEGFPVVSTRGAAAEWTRYWVIDPRPSGIPVNYGSSAETIEEALAAVAMANNIMVTAESVATRYTHPGVAYLPLDDVPYCQVELCTRRADRRATIRALRLSAEQ